VYLKTGTGVASFNKNKIILLTTKLLPDKYPEI